MTATAEPANSPLTDAQLVAAARMGDREAFGMLLDRHWSLLRSMCRRVLRDEETSDEACQEAAISALVGLALLRSPASFGPWLAGIGLNQSRAILRRQAGRQREVSLEAAGAFSHPQPDPADLVADADTAVRVRAAIDNLPAGQREAVRRYYLDGLNHREVAGVLAIGAGSTKTRLHKARTKLRRQLGAEFPEEASIMTRTPRWVTVEVADVWNIGEMTVAVLLERGRGGRRVPIGMGFEDGGALSAALKNTGLPRPSSHDTTAQIMVRSAVVLEEVRVNRIKGRVFFAELRLAGDPKPIDAKASDALNLAVRLAVPIRISAAILDEDGLGPDASDADIARGAGADWRSDAGPTNLDFEAQPVAEDWELASWFRCGGPGKYEIARDTASPRSGTAAARVAFKGDTFVGGFGGIGQNCAAKPFAERRVRLSGFLRTEDISEGWAGLWLRIDKVGGMIAIDNMGQTGRGITGTTEWTRYEVVMDVPPEATQLAYGYILAGNGSAWADELALEVVGALGEGPPTTV